MARVNQGVVHPGAGVEPWPALYLATSFDDLSSGHHRDRACLCCPGSMSTLTKNESKTCGGCTKLYHATITHRLIIPFLVNYEHTP